jgi:hypothetical protein
MLLASIAGWRLAQGPVQLDFLTPYLVQALNGHGSPFRVTIAGTNLAWAGWDRTLDIRVVGVRAVAEDGRVVANVPEMSVGLSVKGLLRGIVAPTGIDIIGATMRLIRDRTGAFTMALGDSGSGNENANPEVINRLILAVRLAPDPDRPVTYLKRIRILDAQLLIDDRLTGVNWGAPQADVVLLKEDGELRGNFFARLDVGGSNPRVSGVASWHPNSDVIQIESEFDGVKIDRLAAKLPKFKGLEAVHLDVQGHASLTLSISGILQSASFDLHAGKGQIDYKNFWPEGLPIASAYLRGWFDSETERLELSQFSADIGGPRLSGQVSMIKLGEGMTIDGRLSVDRMPLSKLGRYWSPRFADRPRAWVTKYMPSGEVVDTKVTLSISLPDRAIASGSLDALSGTLKFKDTTIHHVEGLPPVTDVAASAVFSRDRFIAKIRHGKSAGLTVTSALLRLTDLQSNNEQAEIDVSVAGSLEKALALIDRPPLGYASRFKLRPSSVTGETKTQLKFKFPVLNDLPLSKVVIQTTSVLRNPRVPRMVFGRTIAAENLVLKVNNDGMEVAGRASFGGVEATVKWIELFGEDEKYPRRYEAKAILGQAQRDAIGLINLSPFLEGPVAADVAVLQPRKGPGEVALKLALRDASLWVPGFRWRKPAGREGAAQMRLLVAPDGKVSVPEFSVGSPGLKAMGSIEFDRDRKFSRMKVEKFVLERTDLSGQVESSPDGRLNVDIKGKTLDAAIFLEPDETDISVDKAKHEAVTQLPVNLQANIDRVWFDDKNPVDRLTGSLKWEGAEWRKVDVSGLVGNNQKVTLTYRTETDDKKMVVRSDNAGNALRALDIIDTIRGGTMTLSVSKNGRGKTIPWKGSLNISDFVLANAPVMAKVLTIASFSGIGDTLAGKGIRFAKLVTPFEFRDGIATIRNARTVGAQLGFTAAGTINTKTENIKVSGTIVPAYTINSVLGNIPILGTILTGKNRSGIFAATYKIEGKLEQPKISVNPLAALAPGFLRNLIGVFDGSIKPDKDSAPPSVDLE